MLIVNNVVARCEREGVDALLAARRHSTHVASGGPDSAREVRFAQDREFEFGGDETGSGLRGGDNDRAGLGGIEDVIDEGRRHFGFGEDRADTARRSWALGRDDDGPPIFRKPAEVCAGGGEVPPVGAHLTRSHGHE